MTNSIELAGLYMGEDEFLVQGNVTARFSKDESGETLSLTFEDKCQITVPFEPIAYIVMQTKNPPQE